MRMLVRALSSVSHWLEKRFPEKMTTGEVLARFAEFEERLKLIERNNDVTKIREEIAKLKILNGLQQITGIGID